MLFSVVNLYFWVKWKANAPAVRANTIQRHIVLKESIKMYRLYYIVPRGHHLKKR